VIKPIRRAFILGNETIAAEIAASSATTETA
jgi:hypothetical protein